MPSRVIRSEINSSESLSRVSMEAELTFDRLILAVDDFGRFDARPQVLKAHLFPMRDAVSPNDVFGWVRELSTGQNAPVRLYEVDGRPYLALTGWEKHRGNGRRGTTSKYPEPPESALCSSVHSEEIPDPLEIRPGSGGRETGSEKRLSGVEPERAAPAQTPAQKPEPQAPAPRVRTTPRKPQAALTLAPDRLPDADRPRLEAWLEKRGWEWFASELPREVETCLAHFRANGGSKADWYATAQTWITRAINGGGGFQPMPAERREEIAKRSRSIQASRTIAAEIAAKPTPIRDPPEAEPEEFVFRSVTVGGG